MACAKAGKGLTGRGFDARTAVARLRRVWAGTWPWMLGIKRRNEKARGNAASAAAAVTMLDIETGHQAGWRAGNPGGAWRVTEQKRTLMLCCRRGGRSGME